jgi:hypothetical protein
MFASMFCQEDAVKTQPSNQGITLRVEREEKKCTPEKGQKVWGNFA